MQSGLHPGPFRSLSPLAAGWHGQALSRGRTQSWKEESKTTGLLLSLPPFVASERLAQRTLHPARAGPGNFPEVHSRLVHCLASAPRWLQLQVGKVYLARPYLGIGTEQATVLRPSLEDTAGGSALLRLPFAGRP